MLNHAGENIAGAQRAAPVSPSLALTGAFDAARHCVDAYLNLKGLRARSGDGADRVRVDYAKLAMGELISAADLQDYQTARQIRQMVESAEADRPIRVRQVDAERAIDLAKRFHRAVSSLVDDSN